MRPDHKKCIFNVDQLLSQYIFSNFFHQSNLIFWMIENVGKIKYNNQIDIYLL